MNEMVERVARALCETSGGAQVDWQRWSEETRENYRRHARAAIGAMRGPSFAMATAGVAALEASTKATPRQQLMDAYDAMLASIKSATDAEIEGRIK